MQAHQVREVYPNPPIVLVGAEIRYPHLSLALNRLQGLLAQDLKQDLPLKRRPIEHEVTLSKERLTQERRSVLQFASRNLRNAVTLSNESLIVETTDYGGFPTFLPLLRKAIHAVAQHGEPAGITRVGLRYIDEVRVPNNGEGKVGWSEWIDPSLVAPSDLSPPREDLQLDSWQGRLDFKYDQESAVTLRYGAYENGGTAESRDVPRRKEAPEGPFFLIDIDSHCAPIDYVPEFDPDSIVERLEVLHGPIRSVFDASITQRLVDEVLRKGPQSEAKA